MLRLIQFSRNVGGSFLRASLRDDCALAPRASHPNTPQFLLCFTDKSSNFADQPGTITSYVDQSGIFPPGTSNQVVRAANSGERGRGHDGPKLLQALHYGVILAVGLSLTHDWKRLQGSLYDTPLFCPVVKVRDVKSLQAQPIVERTDEPQHGGVIVSHQAEELWRYEDSISIDKQSNLEDKNSTKSDEYFEVKDLTDELSRLSTTSDYSSHHSRSPPQLSPVEMEIVRLQQSIPAEVDSLLAFQRLRKGEEGAVRELKRLVRENCPSAMFYLGQAYQHGKQVDRNVERAVRLYRAAADMGHCEAKYNLGVHLVKEGDMIWGMALIEEAARMGLEEARAALEIHSGKKQLKRAKPVMKRREVQEVVVIARQMEEGGDLVMAREMYRVAAGHGHRKAARRLEILDKVLERRED